MSSLQKKLTIPLPPKDPPSTISLSPPHLFHRNLEGNISMRSSKKSFGGRRAQSIVKKNFRDGVKAKNIFLAVQEISESEFLNQIEGDINQKKNRFKHLKKDLKNTHRKAKTLSRYLQMENIKNSPKTYKTLKQINQTNLQSSNDSTQLLNLSRGSSGMIINQTFRKMMKPMVFKGQTAQKGPLNDDSIFSILGMELKNLQGLEKERNRSSIIIDPNDHTLVRFQDNSKAEEKPVPKRWKLAKIDFITKNSNLSSRSQKKYLYNLWIMKSNDLGVRPQQKEVKETLCE